MARDNLRLLSGSSELETKRLHLRSCFLGLDLRPFSIVIPLIPLALSLPFPVPFCLAGSLLLLFTPFDTRVTITRHATIDYSRLAPPFPPWRPVIRLTPHFPALMVASVCACGYLTCRWSKHCCCGVPCSTLIGYLTHCVDNIILKAKKH